MLDWLEVGASGASSAHDAGGSHPGDIKLTGACNHAAKRMPREGSSVRVSGERICIEDRQHTRAHVREHWNAIRAPENCGGACVGRGTCAPNGMPCSDVMTEWRPISNVRPISNAGITGPDTLTTEWRPFPISSARVRDTFSFSFLLWMYFWRRLQFHLKVLLPSKSRPCVARLVVSVGKKPRRRRSW